MLIDDARDPFDASERVCRLDRDGSLAKIVHFGANLGLVRRGSLLSEFLLNTNYITTSVVTKISPGETLTKNVRGLKGQK